MLIDSDKVIWNSFKKLSFRFLFSYFFIYILIPDSFYPLALINWISINLFNLGSIEIFPNGSGDTTYNYIQIFTILILALVSTLLWTIIDKNRDNYVKLNYWFRLVLRYYLAYILISYGSVKVFKTQFPFPDLLDLDKKLGDISPMGLVWYFMGYSNSYNIFTGLGEMIGGTLLFSRRLTTLASIINIAVLSNVFMLNMSYDIPVKISSFHLLLISIILIMNDFVRCFKFFILNTAIEKVDFFKPFKSKRADLVSGIFKIIIISFLLYTSIFSGINSLNKYGDNRPKPEMYGMYEVEIFKVNNQEIAPILTDEKRWKKLFIDRDFVAIKYMNDKKDFYDIDINKKEGKIVFNQKKYAYDKKNYISTIKFDYKENNDYLILSKDIDSKKTEIKLKKVDLNKLNLYRGFNWINEYPFNR